MTSPTGCHIQEYMQPLVLYHGECPDGWAAAWAAATAYPGAELVPMEHGDPVPDVGGRDVLLVDICVTPRPEMEALAARARSIRVLDHHVTAADECGGLPYCEFAADESGAGMAWRRLVGADPPWPVLYAEDRDLWRHALPHSHEVNAYLSTVPRTVERWDALPALDPADLLAAGAVVLEGRRRYVESMLADAVPGRILEYSAAVVNAPRYACSELMYELLATTDAEIAATWRYRRGGYEYGIRSRGDVDCAELAGRLGGGGHARAAGFRADRLVH